jgi:hypothetical protein
VTYGTSGLAVWFTRAAHHPKQPDPLPGRATGRPGTRRARFRSIGRTGRHRRPWLSSVVPSTRPMVVWRQGISWSASYRPPARPADCGSAACCGHARVVRWRGGHIFVEIRASDAAGGGAASSCRPTASVSTRMTAMRFMLSGCDASFFGREHGRRLSRAGQR